jgi:TM2 domain-containing membrane protein YozV
MSNRTKALIAAVISFLTIPGLHRFYLGDTTAGILIILFSWLGVGVIRLLVTGVKSA